MQIQYARITKESTWGTFDTGATSTNIFYPRLVENALSADPNPMVEQLTFYDGHIIPGLEYSDRVGFAGTLRWPVYTGQEAAILLADPVSDVLPSFTLDLNDGIEVRRIVGCRVGRRRLSCGEQQGQRTLFCEFTFTGMDSPASPPTFTEPAATSYPVGGQVYSFQNMTGQLLINGAAISNFRSAAVTTTNNIAPLFDESARINTLDYFGRTVEYEVDYRIKDNTARIVFQNQTAQSIQIGWAVTTPAAHSITFTSGTSYYRQRRPERPMRSNQYQALTIAPIRDATTGVDMVLAVV